MTTVMIFKNQVHFPKAFWKSVMHIEQIFIRVRVEFQTKTTFNIASEASYVYILSGQKFIKKNAKIGPIWRVFEKLKLAVK